MRKRDFGLKRDGRGIWRCDFSVVGKRIQRSTYTSDRAAAEEYCATIAARAWRERRLGEAPTWTWREAVAAWGREKQADGKRDLANDLDKARLLEAPLGETELGKLDGKAVNALLDRLGAERKWSNGTRNRYRSFIVGVLNFAKRRRIGVPADFHLERRREAERRVRFLTRDEATRLLAELPLHLRRMVEFSLATGLRQSNVSGLLWADVSLERRQAWVWADSAKGRKHIAVPLNDTAVRVLESARDCPQHGHKRIVFTFYGAAIEQPANSAWLKALRRAGIEDFRWHDLRHTWASWHVQAGTPLPVLQQLGAWADLKMVQVYAHLAPDYTAQFAGNVELQVTPHPALPARLVA